MSFSHEMPAAILKESNLFLEVYMTMIGRITVIKNEGYALFKNTFQLVEVISTEENMEGTIPKMTKKSINWLLSSF
jgi:hypothetical protein